MDNSHFISVSLLFMYKIRWQSLSFDKWNARNNYLYITTIDINVSYPSLQILHSLHVQNEEVVQFGATILIADIGNWLATNILYVKRRTTRPHHKRKQRTRNSCGKHQFLQRASTSAVDSHSYGYNILPETRVDDLRYHIMHWFTDDNSSCWKLLVIPQSARWLHTLSHKSIYYPSISTISLCTAWMVILRHSRAAVNVLHYLYSWPSL